MRLLFILFIMFFHSSVSAQSMKIATYNLRYANTTDIGNLWTERKHAVVDLIQYHQFEIFGVQEAIKLQLEDLKTAMTLRELDGLSYEEIAEVMDCPVGTVRSRIFRAREAVEKKIKPLL